MPDTTDALPFDVAAARAHYGTIDKKGQVAFAKSLMHKQFGQIIAAKLSIR